MRPGVSRQLRQAPSVLAAGAVQEAIEVAGRRPAKLATAEEVAEPGLERRKLGLPVQLWAGPGPHRRAGSFRLRVRVGSSVHRSPAQAIGPTRATPVIRPAC